MILDVLIADDEMPIREWIAYNIGQAADRFRLVGKAKSGTEALTLIAEKKPHVVISDIVMPGMDGIELMRKAQEISPESQFILLTNHADFQFAKQAINYNAFDYLLKSELRSLDLMATLDRIRQTFEASLNKRAEVNPFEDSTLYSELTKDESKAVDALGRAGFNVLDKESYRVFAARKDVRLMLPEGDDPGGSLPKGLVFSGKGVRFMIVKCPNDQTANLRSCAMKAPTDELLVASDAFYGTVGLAKAVRTAERMLAYGELKGVRGLLLYENNAHQALVRKDVRKEQQRISDLIFSGKTVESIVALEAWFEMFQDFSMDDGQWVKDICELMKNTISEVNAHNGHMTEPPRVDAEGWRVSDYRTFCRAGIQTLENKGEQKISAAIQEALKYIHEHYRESISLGEVAQSVYRSAEYFSRQFKQDVGENFSSYLVSYRLHQAKKLLQSGKFTVGETAAMVGYPNASYFSRIYKKYMGITPEHEKEQKK